MVINAGFKYLALTYCVIIGTLSHLRVDASSATLSVSKIISVRNGQHNVLLECPVQGEHLTSVIWILHGSHVIISAHANSAPEKYTYVSPGQLQLNEVSFDDAGIYRCIAQLVSAEPTDSTLLPEHYIHKVSALELVVAQSLTELWNDDYKENIVRASMAAGAALIIFTIACTVYNCRWKDTPTLKTQLGNSSSHSENAEFANDLNLMKSSSSFEGKPSSPDSTSKSSEKLETSKGHKDLPKIDKSKIFVISDGVKSESGMAGRSQMVSAVHQNWNRTTDSHHSSSTRAMMMVDEDSDNDDSYPATCNAKLSSSDSPSAINTHSGSAGSRKLDFWSQCRQDTEDCHDANRVPIASPESESSIITVESETGPTTVIRIH